MSLLRSRPPLPPRYEIRRGGTNALFYEVHTAGGAYIGCSLSLTSARRIAWRDAQGFGKGSVVERG